MVKLFVRFRLLVVVLMALALQACASIYTAPEFAQTTSTHKRVAVLPFDVTIDSKGLPKDLTPEALSTMRKDEAYLFQRQVYMKFLKRANNYTVEFQDVDQTNALLEQGGITYEVMRAHTKDEIAKMLGVDAVVSGNIFRTKPMSGAGAAALGLLIGVWGPTNKVTIDMTIHNGATGSLLWKYTHEASGSVGSSPDAMANSLMNGISRSFPYRRNRA